MNEGVDMCLGVSVYRALGGAPSFFTWKMEREMDLRFWGSEIDRLAGIMFKDSLWELAVFNF